MSGLDDELIERIAQALAEEGEIDWSTLEEGPNRVAISKSWYRAKAAGVLWPGSIHFDGDDVHD